LQVNGPFRAIVLKPVMQGRQIKSAGAAGNTAALANGIKKFVLTDLFY
jgi:hypothetical protein